MLNRLCKLLLIVLLTVPAKTHAQEKYIKDTTQTVRLKDGTLLSTLLIYKAGAKLPLPAVLRISCYPMAPDTTRAQYVADSGYAGIFVYNRGKATSQGVFYPMENDAADNYEIVDWVSKQSWCNGKIGMYGGSYLGFAQWATVKKLHPALKTIVPQVAVGPGIDYPNPGGVFLTYMLQWLKYVRNGPYLDPVFFNAEKWDKVNSTYILNGLPFNRLDSIEGHGMDTIFQRWATHPGYDDYWQRMTPTREEFSRINIPILTTTGYFDDDQRGALHYYNMHNKYGPADAVKEHYLFIGPFDHVGGQGGRRSNFIAPYRIDTAAMVDQKQMILEWFNYTLKGGSKPAFLQDRIAVFVMAENKWHFFPSLDKMNRDTLQYFLPSKTGEPLQEKKVKGHGSLLLSYNTADRSDDTLKGYTNDNALIHQELFRRKHLLSFTTQPLAQDIILNGSFTADLYISSITPDADIMISLWEVDSSGVKWPLSRMVQRLSLSIDKTKNSYWEKGRKYHITLTETQWISKLVKKGSRLLFTISPVANVFWQKNYGSSKDVSVQTLQDAMQCELKFYPESYISIPVM